MLYNTRKGRMKGYGMAEVLVLKMLHSFLNGLALNCECLLSGAWEQKIKGWRRLMETVGEKES